MEQDQSYSLFGMQADTVMQNRLANISRWTKFISIAGIIIVLLAGFILALAGERVFGKVTDMMGFSTGITGALIAVAIFFFAFAIVWFYLLLRASVLIKQGMMLRSEDQLAEGFKMLRLYFLFSVVFTACSLLVTLASKIIL